MSELSEQNRALLRATKSKVYHWLNAPKEGDDPEGELNRLLDAARAEGQPSGPDGLAERDEMLSWLDVSIVRLNGCHDLGEVNLRNKYIRLRALLAALSQNKDADHG